MRVTVFSTRPYDREFLARANAAGRHELVFVDARLDAATAAAAQGSQVVCVFVNDQVDAAVLHALHAVDADRKLTAWGCSAILGLVSVD